MVLEAELMSTLRYQILQKLVLLKNLKKIIVMGPTRGGPSRQRVRWGTKIGL